MGRGGERLGAGARALASASREIKAPSAGMMGELLRGVGAKHTGAKNVLASRLVAILAPGGAAAAPVSTLLRGFPPSKAGKDPAAEAEAMRAAREALVGLLEERSVCSPELIPELVAALGGAGADTNTGERPSYQEPPAPPAVAVASAHGSFGSSAPPVHESAGPAAVRRYRHDGDDLPQELVMTTLEDSSLSLLRERWKDASKRERKALVHNVLQSRLKSLFRRCIESARRCPDATWAQTMEMYVRQRFREKCQPGAEAVLIAQGEHELANMDLMHLAREKKLAEQKRLHSFVGGAIGDGAGREEENGKS